jgi:formylglycine-generating enzyme required for sulfatase activity
MGKTRATVVAAAMSLVTAAARADTVELPGGCFAFGCAAGDARCDGVERPSRRVCVGAFRLDRTEVTAGEYRRCVAAGRCVSNAGGAVGEGAVDRPVTGATWTEAAAFCAWAGGRLPTEAEWEYAARGAAGRTWPWGEEPPSPERVPPEDACGEGVPCPPCSRPAGSTPEGACDLAGNAFEWVADWWAEGHGKARQMDPRGPCDGRPRCPGRGHKVLKGGAVGAAETLLRSSARHHAAPDQRLPFLGFRCAYAPTPKRQTLPDSR